MSKKLTKFVDLGNARHDEQRQVMRQIIDADHCPFCAENLTKYHQQPIIKETKYWLLTYNQWPHANTKLNLLLIYKPHAEKLCQLDAAAGGELIELVAWAEKHFQIPGGGWAMRFGDTRYSAGTVRHLHAQLLVPDLDKPGFEPVRFKIGRSKE